MISQRSSVLLLPLLLLLLFNIPNARCLQQSFRVTPHNVEIVAGSEVTLHCEVDNQQGNAQWTKDGFALGFNRSMPIPGFPRYKVIGDNENGVHNLRITNVQLSDNSQFQCQVSPYNNAQGIRHGANLTVLLPPTSIEMVGHADGSQITVKAGNSLTLECLIRSAKPVSGVLWYRGHDPYRLDSQDDKQETNDGEPHLTSLRTKITFTPSHNDNGMEYSCHAVHPALQHTGTQLIARVTLDVQYPPGPPEITGYTLGETVRAGDTKTLTCRSRGGNPLPEIFWYKNDEQIDKKFVKSRSYAINDYEFTVKPSDNNAKFECHVMNVMTVQPKKSSFHLSVHFEATAVTITAPSEVKVGDIISVSCLAENSNPASDINLVINGQTPPGAVSTTVQGEHGGYNTVTNLSSYEVRPIDADLTVHCYALNQALGSTQISTKIISVLRPPEPPVIIGYEIGQKLRKGRRRTITCISKGGNPPATLQWFKGDVNLGVETKHESGNAIAELDLMPAESDNGAEYRCEASNSATSEPLINSTQLTVEFPPSAVKVWSEPKPLVAGEEGRLICESASSNPSANITWWRDSFRVDPGESIISPGQFGGFTTLYSVDVKVSEKDDGAVYTCQADNDLGTTTHDGIMLSVQYPPVWVKAPGDTVTVTEGEALLVNVSARGNPKGVTYLWKRGDEGVMTGALLNITSVSRKQSGLYTVEASNEVGSISKNVTVVVKYGARIIEVTGGGNLTIGQSATLECRVDASPDPDITWKRKDYDFGRTEQKKHPSQNVVEMTIKNVTVGDTGIFTCHAHNEIGDPASANITIVVKHKPIIDKSPKYQKAAAETGKTARLICRASGAPYVHFTWQDKLHTPIESAIYDRWNNRYSVEPPKLVDGLVTYESVLVIRNVTSRDYGNFTCGAQNILGTVSSYIHLDGTTSPDTPLDLKVVNYTHDSIEVTWTPSFDGGLLQKYRVRFHVADTQRYQYSDVYPINATSFTVIGLALGTKYSFSILAYNEKGESPFSTSNVQATTSSIAPETDTPPTAAPGARVSGLIVVIVTLVGAALLVLNIALVACFIKRRARKRLAGTPPLSEVELAISRVLADKADLPRVVTLSVSTVGGLLVVVNVVLVACVLHRRRQRQGSQASSDKGSSKSTTIEMYAPSSYTGTVTGETLSSISEKSRESYTHEDSADEYDADAARVTAASTYLIEQLDPPPQYASRPPPHILPPPPSHNDLNMDDGYDDVRRNQYNAALDRASTGVGGYNTLNRRSTNTPDHYNITSPDGHYHHYNTYQPQTPHPPLTAHSHSQNNGSLRRNEPSKLHFPKDYIRNGGSMNIPVSAGGQQYPKPQSPTRAQPPHTSMLSTFVPEANQTTTGTIVPLEHRGHLV